MNPHAFIDDFRAEGAEHLRALDAQLLVLERAPADRRPVRAMFLAAHSIKGGATMLELAEVGALAHALEDVLGWLRDGNQALDAATADLLFRAIDHLRALLDRRASDAAPDGAETQELAAALRRQASGGDRVAPTDGAAAVTPVVADSSAGPRILLVEDSATVRLVETMLLQEAGFTVDGAADGAEALKLARSVAYQLIVAGVQSGGLNASELAAAVGDGPGGTRPAVLLTTSDERTPSHGGAGVVYAPKGTFAESRLIEMAREATGWARGGEEERRR